jgi:phage terminase large subunit-like protein
MNQALDVDALTGAQCVELLTDWSIWARPEQLAPGGPWAIWMLMAGRGFGKTRTMAEWARAMASRPRTRGAIIGRTHTDARQTIVEGESGILACAAPGEVTWHPGLKQLHWANGSIATLYSADKPDQLRGPQFHWAIGDEVATWTERDGYHAADQIELATRLGDNPQIVYATTPRPTKRMRDLITRHDVRVTRGRTMDNSANLPRVFIDRVVARYAGTSLGAQELDGELLGSVEGALWKMDLIQRVESAPSLRSVVVAVDPAMTSGPDADETGIVAAGIGTDGRGYVLADRSGRYGPTEWLHVAAGLCAEVGARGLLVEDNTLRETLRPLMRAAGVALPVETVTAYKSKALRASPVVAAYEQGRVSHVGFDLTELEHQMTTWVPGRGSSPDRVDALVHAITHLGLVRDTPGAVGSKSDPIADAVARAAKRPRMM